MSIAKGIAIVLLTTAPVLADPVKITLLGVGDVYNFTSAGAQGGFAKLNAVARAERAANPNMLYLFDGDMLSPSLLSGFDKGQNMIALANLVPFDMAVPGNHEFDFGIQNFFEKQHLSNFNWAAVNIADKDGKQILAGVSIRDVAGVKVALVPVAQDTSPEVSSTGDLVFTSSVETGIAAAKQARKDGADLVVGVVQTDIYNDLKLVHSKAFDVVLSGDDHSYGTSYDGITAYVETGIDARLLSPVDLMVDVTEKDGKRTVKWTPSFRFIDTALVTADPETQAAVDAYSKQLDDTLNVQIGTAETAMDSRRNVVRGEESTMGNLIADAMRAATGADIAIMNGGGIRADRTYDAGTKLTRRDILTELPFGNVTQLTEIPGSQVLAALENGVSQVEKGAGRFPQVSGLTFVYDPKAEAGKRVSEVMVAGAPLEAAKLYKVAVNDFMLGGGDGYSALGGGRLINDTGAGALVANDVMAYVEKQGTVKPVAEGRIKVLGQ
jgi:2',3'-cyclic-nucleotide 2'-phosphodiesterase (5'-nucleotidase family)